MQSFLGKDEIIRVTKVIKLKITFLKGVHVCILDDNDCS